MDLTNQKINGEGGVNILDSLESPLLNITLTKTSNTTVPNNNELIIYVDKTNTISDDIREYRYILNSPLNNNDQFKMEMITTNNTTKMNTYIKRITGEIEILDNFPITLFEGINYLYSNYENILLDLMYLKDNEFNRNYLSNVLYYLNKDNILSIDDIYFANAFTKKGEELNLEVDNIELDCITSKNDKFSLDRDGNLVVNTITTNTTSTFDILSAYPIGSIYLSTNSSNPSSLFGGEWISYGSGRTLMGIDSNQVEFNEVNKTGGEKTHILTESEMPAHTHSIASSGAHTHKYTGFIQTTASTSATYTSIAHKRYAADGSLTPPSMDSSGAHTHTAAPIGSSAEHNNLPPYITCYMWVRTA